MTHSRPTILRLLEERGLSPSRALGQNFVADPNTVRKIARLAEVGVGDIAIEIGPGLGSLTLALVETGAEVIAVEIDRHLISPLESVLEGTGARVIHGDALTVDFAQILGGRSAALVANLPYNVSVPVVMRLLEEVPEITSMVIMVQREVGERLVAKAGTEAYGAVSAKVAYFAEGGVVGRVPAAVFVPKPKVESVLVRLVRHAPPASCEGVDSAKLFGLIKQAFSQRRKMLRSTLRGQIDEQGFAAAQIDGQRRAESLNLDEFASLARQLS